jgi:hypothetical protein
LYSMLQHVVHNITTGLYRDNLLGLVYR